MFRLRSFLNDERQKALLIIKDNLQPDYCVLSKVRLSEFFYPTAESGSSDFLQNFSESNKVSIDFIIYSLVSNKPLLFVFYGDNPLPDVLKNSSVIDSINIENQLELMTNEKLVQFYLAE